jgi:hypothetical protein
MKFNKWTLGLAAIGAVSLASAARAEEAKMSTLGTAVSSTVLSGYVDTSIHWNPGYSANVPNYSFNNPGKADGFNLDSVKLSLAKAEDESEWAAGYQFDMFFGPDASTLNTTSVGGSKDFTIEQAYVSLRTPIGNGIDWKLGVFDTVIGYESTADPNNPNYTRSYGYTIEPTTHTGLYGTYKISDLISVGAGVANTFGPTIGGSTVGPTAPAGRSFPPKAESEKTYMGTVSLTAPNSWGFLGGSSLSAGVINGYNPSATAVQTAVYAGATVNTPITALKTGISWDYENVKGQAYAPGIGSAEMWAEDIALYASFQATEKLSLNGRAEYFWQTEGIVTPNQILPGPSKVFAMTATVQYDLWKNVLSRLEVRWDHAADGGPAYGGQYTATGAGAPTLNNSWLIAANIIYKF